MSTLAQLTEKAEMVEKTFAGHWPAQRLLRIGDDLNALAEIELDLDLLPDPECTEAMKLKRRAQARTTDLLCELLIFAKKNNFDLDSALEEKWMRKLSNRAG